MRRELTLVRLLAAWVVGAASVRAAPPEQAPPEAPSATQGAAAQQTETAAPVARRLDLSYITSGPVMALVLRPREVLASPELQMLPIEVITAQMVETTGIDPTQVEEAIVLVGLDSLQGPPLAAVIARFAEPYDRQAVLERLCPGAEEVAVGEARFHRVPNPSAASVFLPNDRTVVLAPEAELRKMMVAQDEKGPLVDRLRKLDVAAAATGIVVLEPLRAELLAEVGRLPRLPPPLHEFTTIPEHLSAVEVHLQLDPHMDVNLILQGKDEASAGKLNEMVEKAIALAYQFIDARIAELEARGAPAAERASMQYAKRIMALVLQAIDRRVEGDRLVVHVEGEAAAAYASVGVLSALLLPAVQAARQAARRSHSANNLKQIGIAFHNYHDIYQKFPVSSFDKDGKPLLSWRVHILPYIEQQPLYEQFHLDEPWDSEHNRKLADEMPPAYQNPALAEENRAAKTVYLVPTGKAALFNGPQAPRFRDITDGTSNTIAVVEANRERAVIWTKPDDIEIDPQKPLAGLKGAHPGGFQALFCDGSARFISESVDPEMLRRLFDPKDGKPVRGF